MKKTFRSINLKLVLIILLLLVAVMTVTGAFLFRGVENFYLKEFYSTMSSVFSGSEIVTDLREAASSESSAPESMIDVLSAYSGLLGIDSGTRTGYILEGKSARVCASTAAEENADVSVTPNILTAMSGSEGYTPDRSADYMDVALPIVTEDGDSYIVYIIDNKDTVRSLSNAMFRIILESLVISFAIAVVLTLLLSRTLVEPIQSLTHAAEKVAEGDFSEKVVNPSEDEIGTLTRTFNNMAGQLEKSIDDMKTSEKMRREFVANVSHELRTPITSVKSYAETLLEDADALPPDMRKHFLEVMVTESDRMANIVQDLLTLSKFDSGSIAFQFEEFSFKKSVQDVYNAQLIQAQSHNHTFTLEFKTQVPNIIGDRARIEQVLINLVSNSIKYTKDGGRIRLYAGHEGRQVWFSVRDNGIGIPEEDIPHIFERFYRVDKARSRESGGTGLGLSIAYEIVERHHGKIEVISSKGKGTTMTLRLPVGGPDK